MSEKYVKEILDKLEEIEKLHTKLRSLVPRTKDLESENRSNGRRWRSANMADKHPVANEADENKIDSPEQKPVEQRHDPVTLRNALKKSATRIRRIFDSNGGSAKYLRKIRDRSSDGFKRFRSNSVDYVSRQWQDKNERIKNFLSSVNEPEIILVTRAAQTTDGEVNIISEAFQRRRSTLQNISGWLLEHLNNPRGSNLKNTVSVNGHGLGKDEPRKVHRTLFIPDKESETLKIISSARRISVAENRKQPSPGSRTRKLSGKFADIQLEA